MAAGILQAKIIEKIESDGGYVVNVITASKRGKPDLIFCIKGYFIAIEVKWQKDKMSATQRINKKMIESAGGLHWITKTYEEFLEKYNGFMEFLRGEYGF